MSQATSVHERPATYTKKRLVKIADCGKWVSGGTPRKSEPRFWGGDIPWISAKSLKTFELSDSEDRVTKLGADEVTLVPAGTILFVVRGMSLAKEFRVGITTREVTFNQDLRGIIPGEDVDPRYLTRILHAAAAHILGRVTNAGHGTKRLPTDDLKNIKIPMPSLAEQRRIAGILDAADAIRRKRRQAIELSEQLLRSTFLEMFGDPVANPKGWPVDRLESIASVNRGKFTPRPRNDPKYYGGKYPFIQTGDLANCEGLLCAWQQTLNEEGIKVSRLFPRGTVAIAIAANIGDTAILDFDAYATDSVVGIITDPLKAMPRFIEYSLRFHQQRLKDQAPETAQKNINLQVLRPLEIACPPLSLQQRFEKISIQIDEDQLKLKIANVNSGNLFKSLVQRAFRGEL